jgi:hypothetical protein
MNIYIIALTVGGFFAAIPFVIYLGCWCWQLGWAWVDDSEPDKVNKFIKYLCYKKGYTDRYDEDAEYPFYTKSGYISEGSAPFFQLVLMAGLLPIFAVFAFQFYPVALSLSLAIGLAYLCRFARRLNKRVKSHVVDLNAHKTQ